MVEKRDPRRRADTEETRHDQEGTGADPEAEALAAYTEALMADSEPEATVPPVLATTVQALATHARAVGADGEVSPGTRRRLKARIMAAWDTVHADLAQHADSAQHTDSIEHTDSTERTGAVRRRHPGQRPDPSTASSSWWAHVQATLRTAIRNLARQPAWAAAAALVVLAFGVLLLAPSTLTPIPGTAAGPVSTGLWIALGVFVVIAAVIIGVVGRRK